MTYTDLIEIVKKLNLPMSYDHFSSAPSIPFITINDLGDVPFKADNHNYYNTTDYAIDYYFESKDPELEQKIKDLLNEHRINFEPMEDVYIESEDLYYKTYEVNI